MVTFIIAWLYLAGIILSGLIVHLAVDHPKYGKAAAFILFWPVGIIALLVILAQPEPINAKAADSR